LSIVLSGIRALDLPEDAACPQHCSSWAGLSKAIFLRLIWKPDLSQVDEMHTQSLDWKHVTFLVITIIVIIIIVAVAIVVFVSVTTTTTAVILLFIIVITIVIFLIFF
jgi:hypothetical protein